METEFTRLYDTIEAEDVVHSNFMRRIEGSKTAKPKNIMAVTHETLRTKLKVQLCKSRQAKEFEDRLKKEYADIEQRASYLKEVVRSESTQVCQLRAKLHDLISERYKHNSALAIEETTVKEMRKLNLAAFLLKQTGLQKRKTKTATNFSILIGALKVQTSKALEKVESSRNEIEACKEKMRAIRTALVNHFSQILKEGIDARADGLRWVVIELGRCDVKVLPSMFPSFLDAKSIDVITRLADKELELQNLQEFLHNLYKDLNHDSIGTTGRPKEAIKSRLHRVRSENLLKEMTVTTFNRHTKQYKVTRELVQNIDDSAPLTDRHLKSDWSRIQAAETMYENLNAQIDKVQETEVLRIAHDYFYTNSAFRPVKDRRLYLAAIVGEKAVDRYLHLVKKGERDVKLMLEQVKTFSFAKPSFIEFKG